MPLPVKIRKLIEEAKDAADMKDCGFSEEVKQQIRPYLDTWISKRLQKVLEWNEDTK
jgi:hypothetical protein